MYWLSSNLIGFRILLSARKAIIGNDWSSASVNIFSMIREFLVRCFMRLETITWVSRSTTRDRQTRGRHVRLLRCNSLVSASRKRFAIIILITQTICILNWLSPHADNTLFRTVRGRLYVWKVQNKEVILYRDHSNNKTNVEMSPF